MTNGPLTIIPFRVDLAGAVSELNRAWIERFFRMEEVDRAASASDWAMQRSPLPSPPEPTKPA